MSFSVLAMCGRYSRNCYNEKKKQKTLCLQEPHSLCSTAAGKFSGGLSSMVWGKGIAMRACKHFPHSQYNLQVSLVASSHPRAWGCHSNVHGGQACSSRTGVAFSPFWWWLDPLTHTLPCPLLLTSAAVVTVCFQQREGEEKPLWAFGSVQERLTAGVRVWTREPAVSMCCQQSWPDSCCTSCALHVLMAQRRWRGLFENKGFQLPRYPLTLELLWLPGQSITAPAPI